MCVSGCCGKSHNIFVVYALHVVYRILFLLNILFFGMYTVHDKEEQQEDSMNNVQLQTHTK